ncbi:MAG TPA: thioredoxin family protein [Rhabdochlamydiaceae bacterium]|nr:thioredoxin family protein [Rhabdochlamydiaceae bacterium]
MQFLLFFFAIIFPIIVQGQQAIWLEDYKKAVELSKEKNSPLLIVFLGPEECPWSQKLDADILSAPEFQEGLSQDFILLKTHDVQFAKKLHLKEYPMIALSDFQGETLAKMHYLPLSAGDFSLYIKELFFDFQLIKMAVGNQYLRQMPFEQLKTLFQKALRLENSHFKELILEEGLKKDKGAFFLMQHYASSIEKEKIKERRIQRLRKRILERDPKNEHGTHLKIALTDFQVLSKKSKPHKAIKPLLEYTQKFGKQDRENLWKVEMMLAQFLFSHDLLKEALFHASLSLDTAPEDKRGEVSESIEYFKTHSVKK